MHVASAEDRVMDATLLVDFARFHAPELFEPVVVALQNARSTGRPTSQRGGCEVKVLNASSGGRVQFGSAN